METAFVYILLGWGDNGNISQSNMKYTPKAYDYLHGTEDICWESARNTLYFYPNAQFTCVKTMISKDKYEIFLKRHTVPDDEVERLARQFGWKPPSVRP